MFCQKCGQELADNQKFCHKCGAATEVAPVSQSTPYQNQSMVQIESSSPEEVEPEVIEVEEDDDDSDSSGCWVGLFKIVIIALAVWALVHFNPSEEKQVDVVENALAKQVRRNPDALWTAAYVRSNIEYKDFWVVSWTYVEPDGHLTKGAFGDDYILCSVGFCGIVIPFIEIHTY